MNLKRNWHECLDNLPEEDIKAKFNIFQWRLQMRQYICFWEHFLLEPELSWINLHCFLWPSVGRLWKVKLLRGNWQWRTSVPKTGSLECTRHLTNMTCQVHDLINDPPTKASWKQQTLCGACFLEWQTSERCYYKMFLEVSQHWILQYWCNTSNLWHCIIHQRDVYRASIKIKLLTGTYNLQRNRAKFNQFDIDPTCLLCGEDPENREHFLVCCSTLQNQRDPFIKQ